MIFDEKSVQYIVKYMLFLSGGLAATRFPSYDFLRVSGIVILPTMFGIFWRGRLRKKTQSNKLIKVKANANHMKGCVRLAAAGTIVGRSRKQRGRSALRHPGCACALVLLCFCAFSLVCLYLCLCGFVFFISILTFSVPLGLCLGS